MARLIGKLFGSDVNFTFSGENANLACISLQRSLGSVLDVPLTKQPCSGCGVPPTRCYDFPNCPYVATDEATWTDQHCRAYLRINEQDYVRNPDNYFWRKL